MHLSAPPPCTQLCAELGIPYAALLVATNWAAGRHPGDNAKPLNPDEFSTCAAQRTDVIFSCLVDLVKNVIEHGPRQLNDAKRARVEG